MAVGEAGIGKSRLLTEFHDRIRNAPHIWMNGAQTRLYAANNAGGSIDVFDSTFAPLSLATGAFVDNSRPQECSPKVMALHTCM
jgi:hypothetical protein